MNASVANSVAKPVAKSAAGTAKKGKTKTAKAPKAAQPAKVAKAAKPAKRSKSDATALPPNAERLMTLLLAPVISEKGTHIADKYEQVVFRVVPSATKPEVKAAVELMFKVGVESVQISNVGGKQKRFGQYVGKRRSWKKAYVSLKPGQEINFAQET